MCLSVEANDQCSTDGVAGRTCVMLIVIMATQALIERLIASLQEAQFNDRLWPATSALFDDACGLVGNHLTVLRDGPGRPEFLFGRLYKHGEPDEELEQIYINDYFAIDERLPRFFGMANGELTSVRDLFTESELKKSLTYNEFLIPTGAGNSLQGHMRALSDVHIVMALVGSNAAPEWASDQIRTIKDLLPHLQQFVRVRQALADVQIDAIKSTTATLSSKRIGIALLSKYGRILEANDQTRRLLAKGTVLTDRKGFFGTTNATDALRLSELVHSASNTTPQSLNGGSMLTKSRDGTTLVLHVTSLINQNESMFNDVFGRAVLVLIVDPLEAVAVDAQKLQEALGLSPAESRVAAALACGGSVKSVARSLYRSEAAIRWQVRALLMKFGLSSQSELIRLLLTTPGIFDP